MKFDLKIRFKGKYPEIKERSVRSALEQKMSELNGSSNRSLSVLITDSMCEANAHSQEPNSFTVLVLSKSVSNSCDFEITFPEDFNDNFPTFLSRIH